MITVIDNRSNSEGLGKKQHDIPLGSFFMSSGVSGLTPSPTPMLFYKTITGSIEDLVSRQYYSNPNSVWYNYQPVEVEIVVKKNLP